MIGSLSYPTSASFLLVILKDVPLTLLLALTLVILLQPV